MEFKYNPLTTNQLSAEFTFQGEEVLTLHAIYQRLREYWVSDGTDDDIKTLPPIARFFGYLDPDQDPKTLEVKFSHGNGLPKDILNHIQLYQQLALEDMSGFGEIADQDERHEKIDPIFRLFEKSKGLWAQILREQAAALDVFLESEMPLVGGNLPTVPGRLS